MCVHTITIILLAAMVNSPATTWPAGTDSQRDAVPRGVLILPPERVRPQQGVLVLPPERVPRQHGVLVLPPGRDRRQQGDSVWPTRTLERAVFTTPRATSQPVTFPAVASPSLVQVTFPVTRAHARSRSRESVRNEGVMTARTRSISREPARPESVREPPYPPLVSVRLYSAGQRTRVPSSGAMVAMDLLEFHDPNKDPATLAHVGWNPRILRGLLEVPKFRGMLARAVTLAWSRKEIDILCRCRAGRHRSVAAVTLLRMLFHKFLSPSARIHVEHLEERNWNRTCKGRCEECQSMVDYDAALQQIWDMCPSSEQYEEVTLLLT